MTQIDFARRSPAFRRDVSLLRLRMRANHRERRAIQIRQELARRLSYPAARAEVLQQLRHQGIAVIRPQRR